MSRSIIATALLASGCLFLSAVRCFAQTNQLIDGKKITVTGTLAVEHRGNNIYLAVKPGHSYEAVFDSADRRVVQEIGVSLQGQYDALHLLAGKKVTVSGKLQLEPTSPYYLNGTLILATVVRLPDGSTLLPQTELEKSPPKNLVQFYAQVTFAPRVRSRWIYAAWNRDGQPLPASAAYLSCALNGPGDVMNCYCADGFSFTGVGEIKDGRFSKVANPPDGFDFAQFEIDEPVRHYVREVVECTRQPAK
jgi:hypothetical protein